MNELIDKYFAGEMTDREKKDLFDRIETDETLKKEFLRKSAEKGSSISRNSCFVKD